MITGRPDYVRWEFGVRGFEFLKAHDVGLGFVKPVQQVRQPMLLILKLAIFIGSRRSERSDFGARTAFWSLA